MNPISYIDDQTFLIFECFIEHKNSHRSWLALDTGSTLTIISSEVLLKIGFLKNEMKDLVTFGDASQDHIVPRVVVPSFSMGEATVTDLEVLAYTLPEEHGIDGVIGLNFMRSFNRVILDFQHSVLHLE